MYWEELNINDNLVDFSSSSDESDESVNKRLKLSG